MATRSTLLSAAGIWLLVVILSFTPFVNVNAQCATVLNAGGLVEVCEGESVNIFAEIDAAPFFYDFEWLADGVAISGEGGIGDNSLIGYTPTGTVTITVRATHASFPACDVLEDNVKVSVRDGATFVKCTVIDDFSEPGMSSSIKVLAPSMGGPTFATTTTTGTGGGGTIGNVRTNNLTYVSGPFGARADVLEDVDPFLPSPPNPPNTPNPFLNEWFYSSSNDDGVESNSELVYENGAGGLDWTQLCGCESDPTAAFRLFDYIADQSGITLTLTLTDNNGLEAEIVRKMPGSNFGAYDEEFALVDFDAEAGFNWCEVDKISIFMDTDNLSVDFKFRQIDFCKSTGVELGDDDRKLCLGECIRLDTVLNCPIPAANITGDDVAWTDPNGDPVDFDAELCLDAGKQMYEVTVTDELGCVSTFTQTFSVCDTPAISIPDGEICRGESFNINANVTGGNGPLTYSWSPSTGLSCSDCEDPVASPNSTTTYTLTVSTTESGDNGDVVVSECVGTGSVTVTVNPLPQLTIEGVTGLCDGASTTEICASTDDVSYQWSTGASSKCINVSAGDYTVTVTDPNGCKAEAKVTVSPVPSPTVSVVADPAMVCEGTSSTLTATGSGGTPPYTYNWNTGQSGNPIQVMASSPSTTYSVIVSDVNGCTGEGSVTVTASPNDVDGTVTTVDDVCNKGEGEATVFPSGGSGPYTYAWSNGQSSKTITGLSPGTYTVTITDLAGCQAIASGTVGNVGGPSANITGGSPICEGDNSTLTASGSGGTGPYTYAWSPGGATTSEISVSPGTSTTYTVIVSDANECTASASKEVVVYETPTIILTPQSAEICEGGSTGLSAQVIGGTPDYTYAWSPSSGLSCTDCADPTASPSMTQTYTLLVTDDNGCTDEKQITVTVNDNPEVTLDTKVDEDCGMANGSITVSVSGGTPEYSYLWNTSPQQTTATATNLAAGTYTVTVTDDKGCEATLTESIQNLGGPTVTIDGPAMNCIGDDVTLTANPLPFPGDYSYQWSAGLGSGMTATVTNVQTTQDYKVTVTNNSTMCTAEATFTLNVMGCAEITHDKSFVSVVQTGLKTYDVTYEIVVENIGTGNGVYTLLDSLAFDPDVVVNSVAYQTDAPGNSGNPGPVAPVLDGDNRYELAIAQSINDVDPHTYKVVVGVTLDLDNPPAGGNGEYNPCAESTPGDYIPENGLYNLSILDTPNDINDERDEACGDLPIITHTKSGPVISQTGPRAWDVTYTITVVNDGYGSGQYGLVDRPGFDDDIEYSVGSYTTNAPSNSGNPGPQGLFGQGPWTLATAQDIAAGPGTEHVYTITIPVTMDLEDASSAGDEVYTSCGDANGQFDPTSGEGLFNQSELDVNNDGIADEFDEVCGDLPYIVHEKTSTTPIQTGPNSFDVTYTIVVTNLGGAEGQYDLEDAPGFDDDFEITAASFTSDAPGNAGEPLTGSGPWDLADNQVMVAGPGSTHTYELTVSVLLNLDSEDPTGDNEYTECGNNNGSSDPESGEGLFNESRLDVNNDGIDDEIDETCEDVPYIEHEKTIVSVTQNPDDTYEVEYQIKVTNLGALTAEYGLFDEPQFDDDIVLNSASYSSSVHSNTTLTIPAPAGGWPLGNGVELDPGEMHFYTITMNVEMDLNDPATPGDGTYFECGRANGGDDPQAGEGLYNESGLDVDNDGTPDQFDDACGDIPYVTHIKEFVSAIYDAATRTYDVTFKITVDNLGGAVGQYDLFDEISFEDDFVVNTVEYESDAPGHPANGNPMNLVGTNWTLANDQDIAIGGQHMYTIRINVSIDLADPDSPGDEIYTECGFMNGSNDPQEGEGLYNMSRLDRSNDGNPDEEDEACGDVEIVDLALRKTLVDGPNGYDQPMTFEIEVFNQGNVDMSEVVVNDYMPDGYYFVPGDNDAKWSQSAPDLLVYNAIDDLDANASTTISLVLRLKQSDQGTEAWDNYAEIASMKDDAGDDRSDDDIDSTPNSDSDDENDVKPGDPDDDNILGGGPGVDEDEDDHDPAGAPIFDLALIKTPQDLGPYSFGQSIPFDITVFNQGNQPATDINIFDYVPEGYTYDVSQNFPLGWSYTGDPVNIANRLVATTTPLNPGESITVTIWLIINNTDGTNPDAWTNYAEIRDARDIDGQPVDDIDSTPNGVVSDDEGGQPGTSNDDRTDGTGQPGDDEDDHDPAIIEIFDLALRKTIATPGPYTYNQNLTFDIWVFNQGNIVAQDVEVTDYIPDGYSFDPTLNSPTWMGAFPAPTTVIDEIGVGDSVLVSIVLTLEQTDGGRRRWVNYAEITEAFDNEGNDQTNNDIDSNPGSDNSSERDVLPGDDADNDIQSTDKGGEEDDHDPEEVEVFDLAQIVVIDNEQPFYSYGDKIDFKIIITNQGNEGATDIRIVDYVPSGYTYDPADNPDWTQSPTNTPMTLDGLDLEPGETKEIFITLTLVPTDEIDGHVNITEIEGANGADGQPRIDIDSEPNMDAENDEGGQVDTPNDDRLDGDGTSGDDEDDHDPERPHVFDLAQIKQVVSDAPYSYGDGIIFEMIVVNQGNVPATNITITDSIPEGYSFVAGGFNAGWSDTYPEVSYTITDTLFEKDTQRVQIELILEMTEGGADKYTNISEISGAQDTLGMDALDADSDPDSDLTNDEGGEPDGPNDDRFDGNGDPGDDEDDHDPARIEIHDLALRKTSSEVGPFDYNQIITIDLWVYNQGNETATEIELTEYIPVGYEYQTSNNGNWSFDAGTRLATLTNLISSVSPGDSALVQIDLKLLQSYDAEAWDNYAEISDDKDENGDPVDDIDSDSDDDPTNDTGGEPNGPTDDETDEEPPVDEDDHDPFRPDIVDLALNKKVPGKLPFYTPGDTVPYVITIFNQGNVDLVNTLVKDYIPAGFVFDNTIPENMGWVDNAGTLEYVYQPLIESQDSAKINLYLVVQIPDAPTLLDWTNYAEIGGTQDTEGNDRGDDDADSNPGSDADHERDVMDNDDGDDRDDEITGDWKSNPDEDEDDHDPEKVEVTGALGDTVWKDLDGDGVQDEGEPGVAGVIVSLYTCEGEFVRADTTDETGFYFFDFLIPLQSYYAIFDISPLANPDCVFTFPNEGVNDSLDSDVNAAGVGPCTFIEPGERDSTYDAGLVQLASLGDFVWHDRDADGIQDGGDEEGIEGVLVTLYDADGNIVAVDTTDADGFYFFDDLMPVEYYVEFDFAEEWQRTLSNVGGNDGIDSDVDDSNGPNTTRLIDLEPGENDLTWDLGLYKCIPVGDFVWFDINANGIQDGPENGINGVRVYIYDGSGNLVDEAVTGPDPRSASKDGYFKFCVDPGEYYIVFERPGHLAQSMPFAGGDNEKDSDITNTVELYSTYYFVVRSGEMRCDIDGGFHSKATMGDRVWLDVNGNGIQEGGEPRLEGVTISAYREDGTMFDEDISDENGEFNMDGLSMGSYYLKFDPPAGYTFTMADAGGDDGRDSDVDGSNGPRTTALYRVNPGEHEPDVDAGFVSGFLPIELVEFTAKYVGDKVEVRWTTAVEINNEYYEVERRHESEDAYSVVGKLDAAGTVYTTQDYGHDDYDVSRTGVYYYRLKQVDVDGTFARSEVRVVEVGGAGNGVDLYPNPASNVLNVEIRTTSELVTTEIQLVDALGRILPEYSMTREIENGVTVEELNIDNLVPGMYTVQIKMGNDIQRLRFTKM